MRSRRGILGALVLVSALSGVALNPMAASAQVETHAQAVPSARWGVPTQELANGIGQWVYVAPIPAAGQDQLATTGYHYGPIFFPKDANAIVALSTDEQGPIAGISINGSGPYPSTAIIRYDWSPGKFYYLLAYHLGGTLWAGWVYDHAASTWTVIGAVEAPTSGLLHNLSRSEVRGAQGRPGTPFGGWSGGANSQPCTAFPRVDAYSYPPVMYYGTTFTLAQLDSVHRESGADCPTEDSVEHGWFHVRLGTLPG